jgi:hypothetical protein
VLHFNFQVKVEHALLGTMKSSFVEGNLVHVHSEVEEVSKYISELLAVHTRNAESAVEVCWKKCLVTMFCGCCLNKPAEPSTTRVEAYPNGAHWAAATASVADKEEKLNNLLMRPWETKQANMNVRFPMKAMGSTIQNGVEKKAGEARLGCRLFKVNISSHLSQFLCRHHSCRAHDPHHHAQLCNQPSEAIPT